MSREEAVPVLEGLIKKLDHLEVMDGGEARALYQAMRALREMRLYRNGFWRWVPGEDPEQKRACAIKYHYCPFCGRDLEEEKRTTEGTEREEKG